MRNNKIIIVLMLLFLGGACTKFKDVNIDPAHSMTMDPNAQLTMTQLMHWGDLDYAGSIINYAAAFSQHFMGNWSISFYGGLYRKNDPDFEHIWKPLYGKQIKNMEDIIRRTDQPDQKNLNAIARIYQVYLFSILTDLYGDVPYFQAGKGFSEGVFQPAFDKQEDIYKDFFKVLQEANNDLSNDNGSRPVTGDAIYNGNTEKWKALCNSLHLRLALRLVKVDPALAKTEATKAINAAGGLIQTPDNDAIIKYLDLKSWQYDEYRRNCFAQVMTGREATPTSYLCSTFWNHMKDHKDPRLFIIGRCYYETPSGGNYLNRVDLTEEILSKNDMDLFQPIIPGGFSWDPWPSKSYWSNLVNANIEQLLHPQLNNIFLNGSLPGMIITSAEVHFLLSEVAVRWADITLPKSSKEFFEEGVEEAMKFVKDKYKGEAIPDAKVQEYLANNPFPADPSSQIKVINEQLWLFHFTNPAEAYINWKRSGYPELLPSNAYGMKTIDAQVIPRRLNYPLFEKAYNPANYQAAISRIKGGVDDWTQRVWWDK